VAAALVAAVEAVVEQAEEMAATDLGEARATFGALLTSPGKAELWPVVLAQRLDASSGSPSPSGVFTTPTALFAFACPLAARSLALTGEDGEAETWFRRALEATAEERASSKPAAWFDWLPPADLAARIRLEFIRAACPARLSPDQTLKLAEPPQRQRDNL